jgi:hypothetical protein
MLSDAVTLNATERDPDCALQAVEQRTLPQSDPCQRALRHDAPGAQMSGRQTGSAR